MSDTPRTDELFKNCAVSADNVLLVFCRDMERELNALKERNNSEPFYFYPDPDLKEPPYNIEVASQDVENWMLANGVEELNGLALRDKLGRETRRLDWMLTADAAQLNALDQWDRDNIDDAIDREGAK